MSYLVLARKYRPQSFEDLVGQDHVTRTLANAIKTGRVAHAILFTGVRGVGKTTSARLLAKCLACVGPDATRTEPTSTPCQVCSPCREIATGADLDVQEIDGASYNGVDEVRRLQEGLAFRPARDRYKIYIVDEVHMLSTAAWNAFLKTLEEPPPHVKFIFATTEVHKVPVTILSRCQRYDFKLISAQTITKRLHEVLAAEKIEADDDAVGVLAREAAGSMRDAMSLLDQVIAFQSDRLTGADVARVLGVADRTILHELAGALVGGDAAAALRVIDRLAQQSFDLVHVSKDVLRHLRNLVVAKVCGEGAKELLDMADEELRDTGELASKADTDDLVRLYQGFSRGFDDIARSGHPRASLEMALVRLARRPPLLPLDELLVRIGELEKRLATGAPPPAGPRGGAAGGGGGGRPTRTTTVTNVEPESFPVVGVPAALALALAPAPALTPVVVARQPVSMATPVQPVQSKGADLDAWRAILATVRGSSPALASVLEHGVPLECGPGRVVLGYTNAFLSDQVKEPEHFARLTREVRAYFGAPTEIALDLTGSRTDIQSVATQEQARRQALTEAARRKAVGHPLIAAVVRLFGAEIRDLRLPVSD